ncbi:unnamed protein product [Linum tenue]|uniref:Uncharacterized protein n=1 Tax=Linum tenue TaxID=586396 RepID=A0AAV0NEG4_9ROSI|nr:unnamed protein product [Linum tenue]
MAEVGNAKSAMCSVGKLWMENSVVNWTGRWFVCIESKINCNPKCIYYFYAKRAGND